MTSKTFLFATISLATMICAQAQRNLRDVPPADPKIEQASFKVAKGFEVNLWAADPLLSKPTQISFDRDGRLWVASAQTYPQLNVNQEPNDRILILEDSDGDGAADKSSVYYDKLIIPGGVLPDGEGGAYVAHSEQLLHLSDTDADGKADKKTVLLSGFGSEDTHHTLHRLKWGPGGLLYMLQGYYIGTHVETLYGPRRLNGGGLWSYNTRTRRLEIYSRGLTNPWGVIFDRWGQTFQTDGAGGQGINYSFPDAVFLSSPHEHRFLRGLNRRQPKLCGIEVISGSHFPADWRGALVANDFRANNIDRYTLTEKDSGYLSTLGDEILRSTHISFRPIDLAMGPDGALYVADWYSPIIQHGEVDFRDKRRDQVHGRIWRITANGRALVKPPDYRSATIQELLNLLRSDEDWVRLNAKQELKTRDVAKVTAELEAFVASIKPGDDHSLLEALWTAQTTSLQPQRNLLARAMRSSDHRARAAAVRVLYQWKGDLPLLEQAVADSHPRVRREAVTTLGQYSSAKAAEIALRVLDHPMDRFLDFALWRTCRLLEAHWLPAFQRGELTFGGSTDRATFALKAVEKAEALAPLIALLEKEGGTADPSIVRLIGELGTAEDCGVLLKLALADGHSLARTAVLSLADAAEERGISLGDEQGAAALLKKLIKGQTDEELAIAGCRLAGAWLHGGVVGPMTDQLLGPGDKSHALRRAAALSLARLNQHQPLEKALADEARSVRIAGTLGMLQFDPSRAAAALADLLAQESLTPATIDELVSATLTRKDASTAVAVALASKTILEATAIRAMRLVDTVGKPSPEFAAALAEAGKLQPAPRKLEPGQMDALLAKLQEGDPRRGKDIYGRAVLGCVTCHALEGKGGVIGPDLSSIGASAPVDYLIESLIEPSKTIKEGYRMTLVTTKSGDVFSGAVVRDEANVLILRSAAGAELRVPNSEIESRETSALSMMPPGLTASLRQDEFVDLVAYLASLGKQPQPVGDVP